MCLVHKFQRLSLLTLRSKDLSHAKYARNSFFLNFGSQFVSVKTKKVSQRQTFLKEWNYSENDDTNLMLSQISL